MSASSASSLRTLNEMKRVRPLKYVYTQPPPKASEMTEREYAVYKQRVFNALNIVYGGPGETCVDFSCLGAIMSQAYC